MACSSIIPVPPFPSRFSFISWSWSSLGRLRPFHHWPLQIDFHSFVCSFTHSSIHLLIDSFILCSPVESRMTLMATMSIAYSIAIDLNKLNLLLSRQSSFISFIKPRQLQANDSNCWRHFRLLLNVSDGCRRNSIKIKEINS